MEKFKTFLLRESKEYQVPSDPELLFYDFYVLSYLRTINYDVTDKAYKGNFIGNMQNIESLIDDAENKFLASYRAKMLEGLFIPICNELEEGHLDPQEIEYFSKNQFGPHFSEMPIETLEIIDSIITKIDDECCSKGLFEKRGWLVFLYLKYKKIIEALRKNKISQVLFVKIAFLSLPSDSWKKICNAWLNIYFSQTKPQLYVNIDHAFDLYHHNGMVLEKSLPFYKNKNLYWLIDGLDFKATHGIYDLIKRCSSDLRRIALLALKSSNELKQETPNKPNSIPGFILDLIKTKEYRKYDSKKYLNNEMGESGLWGSLVTKIHHYMASGKLAYPNKQFEEFLIDINKYNSGDYADTTELICMYKNILKKQKQRPIISSIENEY